MLNKQFLGPFVSQKGTSWNLSSFTVQILLPAGNLLQGPSLRPDLGDGDGKPTSALASVSIKPGAFSSTESLQFETHVPFIFVL